MTTRKRIENLLCTLAYLRSRNRFLTSNFELAAILYLSRIPGLAYEDMVPNRQSALNSEQLVDDLISLVDSGCLCFPDPNNKDSGWTPSSSVHLEGWKPPARLSNLLELSPRELVVLARAVFEVENARDGVEYIRRSITDNNVQQKLQNFLVFFLQ